MKNIFLLALLTIQFQAQSQKAVPYFGNINWVNGFAKEISGENIQYFSAYPDYATTALLTRATDGNKTIEWETAPVPQNIKGPYVYFSWVAGHASATSGGNRNFDLYVNDKKLLTFTTLPANQMPTWSYATPDSSRLVFQQTIRDGANDAHGLAFLRLPVSKVIAGAPIKLKVVGEAQGSNDWYMTFKFSFEEKVDVSPTPCLLKNGKQPVSLTALHFGKPQQLKVVVNNTSTQLFTVKDGMNLFDIVVDPVQKTDSVFILITAGNKTLVKKYVTLQPVKHKTIYILPHSHFDVGYTEIQTEIEKKQVNNLIKGMEFANATKNYPEGSKFVWNLEGTYTADLFLNRMNANQKKQFMNAVKKGQVSINGMFLNTLTGLCRPEELLQLFKYSTELSQQTGVKIDAAMISDVPGYTWGTVTAMAQAGIKYFSPAPNYFDRIGDILQKCEEKPFYWLSPSGKEKVLVWIPYKGYALSHGVPHLSAKFVATYISHLNEINFPYDISYMRWSGHGDNAVPEIEISDFVKDWNAKYEWPRFIISSTSKAFAAFEKKYGSQLPELKGDWTGYWEDGAGSSAFETSQNRASSSRLTQAETMWAMVNPTKFPADEFKDAWRNVLLYSEHTWGADESVSNPLSKKTTEQWDIKKSYATIASNLSIKLLNSVSQREENSTAANSIQVFNTNSWQRSGLVLVQPTLSSAGDMVKDATGKSIPSQRLSTGELAFVATDIAPFAAKQYHISSRKSESVTTIRTAANSLDNGIVKVTVDEITGAIKSIRNHTINNNFADSAAGNYLNDYLFLNGDQLRNLQRNGIVKISVKENGPVLSALLIESTAPGCNKLTRELRLVNGFDFVEMNNVLDKKPAELNPNPGDGAWANTGGKESVNFGFPFNVSGGDVRLNIPLAAMRPETDQMPGACKNWLSVGEWADVSNKDFGITWATLDAPLVQIGGITATLLGGQTNPDIWRKKIEPTQKIYSWALNNHWETNYRAYQDGIISFRYALKPHNTFDAIEASQFATGLTQPLIVTKSVDKDLSASMLQLSAKAIEVLVLKPSEDGKAWMVTLFNPTSQPAKTRLHWNIPVKSTSISNSGEVKLSPAPTELELGSLEVMTLRVDK
jgi:hypothetical protein